MKRFAWIFLLFSVSATARGEDGGTSLPRSLPETQGVSSEGILEFIDEADKSIDAMHSVMVLRHGQVVAEGWWKPYASDLRHTMFSVTKSFSSTGIGIAVAEGKLKLDDTVLSFFPEDAPENPSDNLKAMRVRDLLRMSTGHQTEAQMGLNARGANVDKPWTKIFLEQPVPFKPGTHFMYNTPGSYMLSAIVQKATGEALRDYLEPRLFGPLGIKDLVWDQSPQKVTIGGYGLNLRTKDLAKFGQLYLQKGKWQGKQLLTEAWVEEASKLQTGNGSNPKRDGEQGYGYQFWRARHNGYRADGAFGQYCIVLPDLDAVVVITSGVRDMQKVMNVVWDHLLPAFKSESLPEASEANKKLQERLAKLELPTVKAERSYGSPPEYTSKTYRFPANDRKIETIKFKQADSGEVILVMKTDGKETRVTCGYGEWIKGTMDAFPFGSSACAASGAWISDSTYKIKIYFQETPFSVTYLLSIKGDELKFDAESHVTFGGTDFPTLTGKAE